MKLLTLALALLFSVNSYSGVPLRIPLEKLAKNTDHVLTGYVSGVDMIDGEGNQISDLKARTGPGSKNKIRLIIQVQKVHLTSEKSFPNELAVPLASHLHYSFGQIKKAHSFDGREFLILLKGKDFQPPFSGVFSRNLSELKEVVSLIKKRKPITS